YNYEVVACSLIFVKDHFHFVKLKLIILKRAPQFVKKLKICRTMLLWKCCKDINLLGRHTI
ncbi:MAG TPA: hypothetical protein PKN60_11670, partial [Bacteroidales bacterium]|nr:hypothetical protein [Bacteroidales bacterium]